MFALPFPMPSGTILLKPMELLSILRARKGSVHCHLPFAGMKSNPSNKTELLSLHLLPKQVTSPAFIWLPYFRKGSLETANSSNPTPTSERKQNVFCCGFSLLDRQRHIVMGNVWGTENVLCIAWGNDARSAPAGKLKEQKGIQEKGGFSVQAAELQTHN